MRSDIQKLIESRPLYKLMMDRDYRELLEAIDYAQKTHNHAAEKELENMLEERKRIVLG